MQAESKQQIRPDVLIWLISGLSLCILPHSLHLPSWIMLLAFSMIIFRTLQVLVLITFPSKLYRYSGLIKGFLVICCFIGVFAYFNTLTGRDAGTALLVLLTGFKLLETYTARDYYFSVFLGFFVIITNFFFTQSIGTALLMFVTVFVLTCSLIVFNYQGKPLVYSGQMGKTATMLAHAFPLMLILFLLFPRIEGPLWGMPKDAHAGLTGLSNEMEPGSISELIKSDDVAFRVEFLSKSPPHDRLYWRGPVFWYNDGRKWSSKETVHHGEYSLQTSGPGVQYTLTMEPHNRNWLLVLEMPTKPGNGYITYDYQFRTWKPVRSRQRYTLTSYPDFKYTYSNRNEIIRSLQLPGNAHEKTIALARQWRKEATNDQEIIYRALNMFNSNFHYTLTPPLVQGDNVDDFLFNTRKGFCEHYAGSFVVLMRAAGIPARVVTGYQGGSFNPIGKYFNVYQRDAHAWAEVWLNDRGWIRVDPTTAVSPERVEQGIENALPGTVIKVPAVFGQNRLSRDLWVNMQNTWDAINNQWNQWFISYGPDRQQQFLKNLGLEKIEIWSLMTLLLLLIAGLLYSVSLWIQRQRPDSGDTARKLYDQFCRKLARCGIIIRQYEGPVDLGDRVANQHEKLGPVVKKILSLYVMIRYASRRDLLDDLQREVRDFNPEKILKQA